MFRQKPDSDPTHKNTPGSESNPSVQNESGSATLCMLPLPIIFRYLMLKVFYLIKETPIKAFYPTWYLIQTVHKLPQIYLHITQPSQYRCTQLPYRFTVIFEATSRNNNMDKLSQYCYIIVATVNYNFSVKVVQCLR